jgi:hypothetical protein
MAEAIQEAIADAMADMKVNRRETVEKEPRGKTAKTVFKEANIDEVKAKIQKKYEDIEPAELKKMVNDRLDKMWEALSEEDKKEYKGSRRSAKPKKEAHEKKEASPYIKYLTAKTNELKEQGIETNHIKARSMAAEMWHSAPENPKNGGKGKSVKFAPARDSDSDSDDEPVHKKAHKKPTPPKDSDSDSDDEPPVHKKADKKASKPAPKPLSKDSDSEDEDDEPKVAPKKADKKASKPAPPKDSDSEDEDDEPPVHKKADKKASKPTPKPLPKDSDSEDEDEPKVAPKKASKPTPKPLPKDSDSEDEDEPKPTPKKADKKQPAPKDSDDEDAKPMIGQDSDDEDDGIKVSKVMLSEKVNGSTVEKEYYVDSDNKVYDDEYNPIGDMIVSAKGVKTLVRSKEE